MTDSGSMDKIKGTAKEVTGKATGDKGTQAEGIFDQVVGKVKEVASDVKDNAEDLIEDVKEKFDKK